MARIRTIKPEFWDDLKLSKITRDSRLLYIGLWNFSDDLGVIIGDSLWIKSKVFPFDQIQMQQFEKWIEELVKNGFISQFSHKGEDFYYLPNLTRHQVINRPNYDKVFIQKVDLENVIKSLINHGTFSDESLTIHTVDKEEEEERNSKKESSNEDKKEAEASSLISSNVDYLKFNDWLKHKAPFCSNTKNFQSQITEAEFLRLKKKYTSKQIADVIEQLENRKDLRKRYTNLYRTVLNWAKKAYGD